MHRYQILHRTEYRYSEPVHLGTHTLHLRPREGHDLRIEASTIEIQPQAFLRWHRDVEDNCIAIATFDSPCQRLLMTSRLVVQQYDQQPLNFLVEDYAVQFPFVYDLDDRPILRAYLLAEPASADGRLAEWTASVWQPGEAIESYALLRRLNRAIHAQMAYQRREEPGVQAPSDTLRRQSGSCRDLAFLFMEVAKRLGFAARFVSGYSYSPVPVAAGGSTHAWAEVFLPGAGWKGFDPTRGDIVGGAYIPVAVARIPHTVPPIAGSFQGAARLLAMEVAVSVNRLPS